MPSLLDHSSLITDTNIFPSSSHTVALPLLYLSRETGHAGPRGTSGLGGDDELHAAVCRICGGECVVSGARACGVSLGSGWRNCLAAYHVYLHPTLPSYNEHLVCFLEESKACSKTPLPAKSETRLESPPHFLSWLCSVRVRHVVRPACCRAYIHRTLTGQPNHAPGSTRNPT
jgi:hypothetical protein